MLLGAFLLARPTAPACTAISLRAEQITDGAEQIVRVRALGELPDKVQVELEVLEVLKGTLAEKTLLVGGHLSADPDPNDKAPPYNFVRRGGRGGACFAFNYLKRGQFVLFLRRGTPYWAPLSAVNEEVSGPDDPWVQWIKRRLGRK
jgi:hypothetical protein